MAFKLASIAIVLCAVVALVAAHGHMTVPTARSGSNDNLRTACSATATASAATYSPSSTITVDFNIEANHGGNASFYLSYNGNPSSATRVGPVTAVTRTGDYAVQITLGAQTCTQCLLEWIWQSTEATPYYGCATVVIGTPAPTVPTATPTHAPSSAVSTFGNASLLLVALVASFLALAF